jgi:hypothetical protein
MEKRYQVFVSSTFTDLEEERNTAVQSLMTMDCIPAGMELFPAADIEQFEFIKTVIDDCDYYVLIIGGRYGTITEDGISFTEKEYDYAIEKNIPVLAFLHENPEQLTVEKSEVTLEAIEKLNNFKDKASKGRLVKFWNNKDQLAYRITAAITMAKKIHPAVGWLRADKVTNTESLEELNELRKENSFLKNELSMTNKKLNERSLVQAADSNLNLADLNQELKIKINSNNYSHTDLIDILTKNKSHIFTWAEVFKAISPHMLKPISEYTIRQKLTNYCAEKNNIIEDLQDVYISDDSFQTIKIQYMALGYIELGIEHDNYNDEFDTWELSSKGKQAMFDLVAIKNT